MLQHLAALSAHLDEHPLCDSQSETSGPVSQGAKLGRACPLWALAWIVLCSRACNAWRRHESEGRSFGLAEGASGIGEKIQVNNAGWAHAYSHGRFRGSPGRDVLGCALSHPRCAASDARTAQWADEEYHFHWRHGERPTPVTIYLRQVRHRRPVRGLTGRAWPGRDARHDYCPWADAHRILTCAISAHRCNSTFYFSPQADAAAVGSYLQSLP